MPIKIAFRRRYITGLANRHKAHKQVVLRILHKIRSHPAFFKPGYSPSKAGVPKSIPKQPAGLNAKGAGFWSSVKKGFAWIKGHFNKHKGKIYEAAKKHGAAAARHVGSRVLDAGKRAGKQVVDRAISVAEPNVEHYTSKAEKKLQSLADKAEYHISQYDRPPKKGSGMTRQQARRVAQSVLGGGRGGISNLGILSGALRPSMGVLSSGRRGRYTMAQMVGIGRGRGRRR